MRTTTQIFGTVASAIAAIIFAPCRMMPCRSTAVPTMKPGTSARNSSGIPNASQVWMNRAALSAESTNSTPPLNMGLFAITPMTWPSRRAKPVTTSLAHSAWISKNPLHKGGVLFVDSADKAARFIQTCDAFGIPLLFLADVPGFMVGTAVERQGIIRHGAKMIAAMADATVPKICVIVRKAYGAGLYAMAGPGFGPDATLALPTAKIAVMGAEAAVNAVYANKLEQIADEAERAGETERLRREYEQDIDILRLAAELVVDDIVEPEDLREELERRFAAARGRDRTPPRRRHGISPA